MATTESVTVSSHDPAEQVEWEDRWIDVGDGQSVHLRVLPDASNRVRGAAGQRALYYCVPATPQVARTPQGEAKLSLTLILDRQPDPAEPNVRSLVQRGTLVVDFTLLVPTEHLRRLAAQTDADYRPLFVRRACYRLGARGRPAPLGEVIQQGLGTSATLTVPLGRDDVLDVLGAIQGGPCNLQLSCEVAWRLRPSTVTQSVVFEVHADDAESGPRRRDSAPAQAGTIPTSASGAGEQTMELVADLGEVLAGVIVQGNMDRHVQLLCPATNTGELGPVSRHVRDRTSSMRADGVVAMAAVGDDLRSLPLALSPTHIRPPLTASLLAHDAIRRWSTAPSVQHWAVDDLVIGRPGWLTPGQPHERSLPVVDDPGAPLWTDRITSARFWYAPDFVPLLPAPNDNPASAPFRFALWASGHDITGQPGLEGSIRVVLRPGMSDATRAAWEQRNKPAASPVTMTSLGVSLELPFRDEQGATKSQSFRAESVEKQGELVVATFRLLNQWVRLGYGALSTPNFQTQPARFHVDYSFEAYVPLPPGSLQLACGGKIARIPVVRSAEEATAMKDRVYVDATRASLRLPEGELLFAREGPQRRGAAPMATVVPNVHAAVLPASSPSVSGAHPAALHLSPGGAGMHHLTLPVAIRPELESQSRLEAVLKQTRYGVQTRGITLTKNAFYPCTEFGAFYVEVRDDGEQAIGCRDALKLAQTEYKLYAPLDEPALLAQRAFRVYRSLQVPGRFLVVPATYAITRFEPTEGERAYRPAILLFSTIDANDPDNSRCVVMATLQPDLPQATRRDLEEVLKRYHTAPTVEYVTEIESELTCDWSIPAASGNAGLRIWPQVTKHWDSFQVGLAADVYSVPQLQIMLSQGAVTASVRFTLPDDSQLETTLRPDLTRIAGPWERGPIEVTTEASTIRLTNRIECPVDISDLRAYTADGQMQTVCVDQRLEAGASCVLPVPPGATEFLPVYTIASSPGTLPEIRSYIEDIHTNVIFLNLVNYANHNLRTLAVTARLKDVAGEQTIAISEAEPAASVDFVLPLTQYLASPVLQYRVVKTDTANQTTRTDWIDWSLTRLGNVVSITWDSIQ